MSKATLVGNVNDIENMASFLINKCGLKPEEVQKFSGKGDYRGCQVKKKRK
jgi:hypothetical protein